MMLYFMKRFAELVRAILPLQIFYIFVCCIVCVYFETDVNTTAALILGGSVIFYLSAGAGAFGDCRELRRRTADAKIIGDCFSGFSKKSRLFSSGFSSFKKNMLDDALEDFKKIEDMDISERERAVLCFYIGSCYRYMGYPTNAANYYSKSIDNNIDSDYVYILAARCCVSNGSYAKAMEIYNLLLGKDEYFEYVYTDMGMCALKSENPDKALEYFKLSIAEGKNYSFALGGCSLAYLMKKDIDKSKEFFSKALINNINDVDGFRQYYCSVAEANGCLGLIDENIRKKAAESEPREYANSGL
ncbi:MAG: tetratricopeptide repeat protein [Oscillospiraceae bacterium]|nr:tetratricopeptide repeat protein [Oscillospiraceae bacterium]